MEGGSLVSDSRITRPQVACGNTADSPHVRTRGASGGLRHREEPTFQRRAESMAPVGIVQRDSPIRRLDVQFLGEAAAPSRCPRGIDGSRSGDEFTSVPRVHRGEDGCRSVVWNHQ